MEIWKDTLEDPKNYEVSNCGRIRNKNTRHILKNNKTKNGYLKVTFGYGRHTDFLVHRIVANAFIENPNFYRCINHIDENKANNNIENLEWCTHKYNNNYGIGSLKRNSKVVQIDSVTNERIKEWDSMKSVEEELGICYQTISACCRFLKKTAGGYKWEYLSGINEKKRKNK